MNSVKPVALVSGAAQISCHVYMIRLIQFKLLHHLGGAAATSPWRPFPARRVFRASKGDKWVISLLPHFFSLMSCKKERLGEVVLLLETRIIKIGGHILRSFPDETESSLDKQSLGIVLLMLRGCSHRNPASCILSLRALGD